jgi:hypothetical protein
MIRLDSAGSTTMPPTVLSEIALPEKSAPAYRQRILAEPLTHRK